MRISPAGDVLQPREHAQQRRLPAARRADQNDEFDTYFRRFQKLVTISTGAQEMSLAHFLATSHHGTNHNQ
jgi:hypothetical protein